MAEEKYIKLLNFDINKELKDIQFNKDIKKIQEEFIKKGYSINNHGKFDKYLFGAICDYQRKNNLKVIGEITEETWNKLFNITKENVFINKDKEITGDKLINKMSNKIDKNKE